jgi:hypothetical protein
MEALQNNEANVEAQTNGDEMILAEQEVLGQHGQPSVAEQTQEQPLTEESEARKFQSMYDRSQAELKGLKKYEPLVNLLESRPDLVQKLQDGIAQNPADTPQSTPGIGKDEFNPWEAFTEKGSASNRHVKNEMENMANQIVSKKIAQQQQEMQTQLHLNNTVNELRNTYKMSDSEIKDFLQFTTQPKEAVGMGNLVKLYRDVKGTNQNTDTISAVKAAQEAPRSAGVLQGQAPKVKNDLDAMWDSVVKAGARSKVL